MYIPAIIEVKTHLDELRSQGLVKSWELPYENILTRLSAAIFFLTPEKDAKLDAISNELKRYDNFSYRPNEEKTLSQLEYRITFARPDT
ncbi:hypothetical protein [Chryseolinea lacunae]|uniref:Uncharacterized protein n=1 Tax=Chryseolinea lacunae TaxID=2801331 RepID=A0ABS1KUA8_9BACT|nr:hypothetical protein [Chryseolinea lacunae]MBL0743054.1 hypothetical protein [Chryseolinea lacunae]